MRTKSLASQARASPGKPIWTSQTLPSSPCQAEGHAAQTAWLLRTAATPAPSMGVLHTSKAGSRNGQPGQLA